ncbi:FAD-dependent oxidoreductase [Shigella sonnei]
MCRCNIVRSMQGMENAKIVRPGYAIEYDFSIHAT